MISVGFDPGSRFLGYAAIEVNPSGQAQLLDSGSLKLNPKKSLGERFIHIREFVGEFLSKNQPEILGVEKAFVHKSVPSAFVLAEARGVLKFAMADYVCSRAELVQEQIYELTPTEIKKNLVGSGRAQKASVQKVVAMRFLVSSRQKSDLADAKNDAFDAIAIAWSAWIRHKGSYGSKTWTSSFDSRCRFGRSKS